MVWYVRSQYSATYMIGNPLNYDILPCCVLRWNSECNQTKRHLKENFGRDRTQLTDRERIKELWNIYSGLYAESLFFSRGKWIAMQFLESRSRGFQFPETRFFIRSLAFGHGDIGLCGNLLKWRLKRSFFGWRSLSLHVVYVLKWGCLWQEPIERV